MKQTTRWTKKIILTCFLITGVVCWICVLSDGYCQLGFKGVLVEILATASLCSLAARLFWHHLGAYWKDLGKNGMQQEWAEEAKPTVSWNLLFVSGFFFFAFFPFSIFLHSVGITPGILFLLAFSYSFASRDSGWGVHNLFLVLVLGLCFWLWGEAGRPGLIVMPVDLPEGRGDLNFTPDGVANAIETELQNFGSDEGAYGGSESSIIFSKNIEDRLFPRNPWYKGSEERPQLLEGLQTSHVITGTGVEGFPLVNVYHILRHLRGMPLLEAQILLGDDRSLTLSLRRSNAPLDCMDDAVTKQILDVDGINAVGRKAAEELWALTRIQRTSIRIVPDTRGCKPSWIRSILAQLDIVHLPSSSEQRLANVTVRNLQGDERLTTAIHFAAIEAMKEISPERLAVYYDNKGRYDSSLYYFKYAIPSLLNEAHQAQGVNEEYVRRRFASALVRIGDFEGNCSVADRAYRLAKALLPDDLHVNARIGYSYLVRAQELRWDTEWIDSRDQNICTDAKSWRYQELLTESINYLRTAVDQKTVDVATNRIGLVRKTETLAWAESNLAYALILLNPKANRTEAASLAASAKKAAELLGWDHPWDLRPIVIDLFAKAQLASSGCGDLLLQLRDLDPTPEDQITQHRAYYALTLHNTLLMEEQFIDIYKLLAENISNRPAESVCKQQFATRVSQRTYHEVLFRSLLTLSYIQRGVRYPKKPLNDVDRFLQTDMDVAIKSAKSVGTSSARLEKAKRQTTEHIRLQRLFLATFAGDEEETRKLCAVPIDPTTNSEDSARFTILCIRAQPQCYRTANQIKSALHTVSVIPTDVFLRTNLALLNMKLGNFADANVILDHAVRLNPDEPGIRWLRAFSLNATDQPEAAREEWNYGRLLDPEGWRSSRYRAAFSVCSSALFNPFQKESAENEKMQHPLPRKNRVTNTTH